MTEPKDFETWEGHLDGALQAAGALAWERMERGHFRTKRQAIMLASMMNRLEKAADEMEKFGKLEREGEE